MELKRISRKKLLAIAKKSNAIDLTNDTKVRKGCKRLIPYAYSGTDYMRNGVLLVDENFNFYAITWSTVALWVYGVDA